MDTGFKFQVRWDGRVVVGVTKVSALKRSTEVIEHREGGDPRTSRKSPELTKFQPIVLKRGVTHDPELKLGQLGISVWCASGCRSVAEEFSKGHRH